MKSKRTYCLITILLILTILALSACNSNNLDENYKIITVMGGPQQYQAKIDISEDWQDLDLEEKKDIVTTCITSCQSMQPALVFSIVGINKSDNTQLFTWTSSDEFVYIDGEKVDM